MRKLLREEQGFTLIELIMVIVILGILAVVAIPKYSELRDEARAAAEQGVIGGVRGGISAAHADSLIREATNVWPQSLEAANLAKVFEAVLETGVDTTRGWSLDGNTYTGPTGAAYTYDPTTGSLE